MSSKTVSVPKYRHHKGSGQAFVQVNGRRHYLGKWDSPKSKERYARLHCRVGGQAGLRTTPHYPRVGQSPWSSCARPTWDFAKATTSRAGNPPAISTIIRQVAVRRLNELYGHTAAAEASARLAMQAMQHAIDRAQTWPVDDTSIISMRSRSSACSSGACHAN